MESYLIVNLITNNQIAINIQPILTQGFQITMLTTTYHIQMIGASDKSNPPTTCIYQMLSSHLGCLITISCHTGETVRKTSTSEEHQRNTYVRDFLKMTIVCCCLSQTGYNAFNVHSHKSIYSLSLIFEILMTICTQNTVTSTTGLILNTIKDCCIVMCHQVGDDYTNNFRGFFTQTLSKGIGAIIKFPR